MKLNLKTEVRSQKSEVRNLASDFRPLASGLRHPFSERGIALVITLILLSVTLVMALAFLAITNRERGSVTTESDTATARLAADAALAHAEAQIMANILSTTNPYSFSLIVSTNYINYTFGFQPGIANPTNVSYVDGVGAPLNGNNFLQNLNNLLYLPRAPVYFPHSGGGSNEFRFFLNLNQNLDASGYPRFDPNGVVAEVDNNNAFTGTTNFNEVGDPEWIGGLERPDVSHGPNNRFLYRYAFIAVPVGNGLDANYIHNQAKSFSLNSGNDGFFRNEGVGTWEINLAAFLTDLNTNIWDTSAAPYNYERPNNNNVNTGRGFEDALSILSYRYGFNYNTLAIPSANAYSALVNAGVDGYTFGSLMTNTQLPFIFTPLDSQNSPWVGSDNTNHFFTPGEFFDPTKTAGFSTNLLNAGTNNSSYDRYTFYRMLSQLGTDSSPESGKMNINYDNLSTNASGVASATNFLQWSALGFFTNAADRMLRTYTTFWFNSDTNSFFATFGTNTMPFGMTTIPVYVDGRFVYSSAIQRVLQLAANIYDASTTNFYPSRFRPIFRYDGTNVFITSYVQQTSAIVRDPTDGEFIPANTDLALPCDASFLTTLPVNTVILTNVYGVPWIIGAKKGFPNFNQFALENAIQVTRKLQYSRNTTTWQWASNQMYVMSISNFFGIECWNSYVSSYPKTGTSLIDIMARDSVALTLSNMDNGTIVQETPNLGFTYSSVSANSTIGNSGPPPYSVFSWPGYQNGQTNSFLVALNFGVGLLPTSIYNFGGAYGNVTYTQPGFIATGPPSPLNYQDQGTPLLPHFVLVTTNRLQVAIVDYSAGVDAGQIIDYVQLGGMNSSLDINAVIDDPTNSTISGGLGMWSTNMVNNEPYGVQYQTSFSKSGTEKLVSEDAGQGDGGVWNQAQIPGLTASQSTQQSAQGQYFNGFFTKSNAAPIALQNASGTYVTYTAHYTSTNLQAPYTPTRTRVQHFSFEANDPLIHYLTSDLTDSVDDANITKIVDWASWPAQIGGTINEPNARYAPWGKTMYAVNVDLNSTNIAYKDPVGGSLGSSDNWDFPTNKYPTVGWLGRVHRGTPWQTVFLKATNILAWANSSGQTGTNTWMDWTGNQNLFDAINAAPIQDRLLFDIFTTAFNDNATRGQLSVNIPSPNLAAWSALFSGIVVPTTITNTYTVIQPAAVESTVNLIPVTNTAVYRLALAIDQTRSNTNLFPLGAFPHVGDILSVPQLTEQSPFLAPPYSPSLPGPNPQNAISDEMYEWLPQQTMSLLRVGSPRYVIYSYGQALKPAPNSIVTSSSFFGMVTNYQVMAETATRAVVRFDSMLTNNPDGSLTITNNNAVIESFNILPPDQN